MTEEIKTTVTEEKECKCFCQNEAFRKILVIAVGSFVGVFCALSLFAALHRPPMMPPCAARFGAPGYPPAQVMMHRHNPHFKGPKCDKGEFKGRPDFGRKAPFEIQKEPKAEVND